MDFIIIKEHKVLLENIPNSSFSRQFCSGLRSQHSLKDDHGVYMEPQLCFMLRAPLLLLQIMFSLKNNYCYDFTKSTSSPEMARSNNHNISVGIFTTHELHPMTPAY